MNLPHCEKEQAVLHAAQTSRWDDELRAHAAECPVCADVLLVARFLGEEARAAETEATLPDPGLIWWKAQRLARQDAARRALRPIVFVERIAYACAALATVAGAVWLWPRLSPWLEQFKAGWQIISPAGLSLQPSTLLLVGGSLLLSIILFALFAVWAEE